MIHFITGNPGKLKEIKALIPGIDHLELALDEIQSLDPQEVIEHKLAQAAAHHEGEFMVEDTSLILNCLGKLPGTYIKAFEESIGLAGIAQLAARYDDQTATARTTIGYRDEHGINHYFVGEIHGTIVPPKGGGFGWDAILIPDGYDKTLGELGPEVKNKISMRAQAAHQLAAYLAK